MTQEPSSRSGSADDAGASADSPVEIAAQDAELLDSLADLSRLTIGGGEQGLADMLRHVAEFAVRAIPGAEGVGLTLLNGDRVDTMVASADFVRMVDAIQYSLGEGPCITAATERRTVHSGALDEDLSWPRFGPQVGRLGVHSALSLPLSTDGAVLGALNVYAHDRDAFAARAVELGELFAVPAAISVLNAQALAQARRLATQLQTALSNRAVIDQAMGILMSRIGCTSGEAFDRLQAMGQAENSTVSATAQSIVDDAVRRFSH